jgi:hypothetical protein
LEDFVFGGCLFRIPVKAKETLMYKIVSSNRFRLSFFIALVALAFAFTPQIASAQVETERNVSFSATVFVDSSNMAEEVDFSGSIHLRVRYLPPNPVLPPNPIRVHTNLITMRGIGRTSGLEYIVNGASNATFPMASPTNFSFGSSYHLLPPNPVRGSDALSFPILFTITLNDSGEITEASANYQIIEGE